MENKEYLQSHLQECLQVIDTCLASIYKGENHMYRPLAGQLRILWCDSNREKDISLLIKLHNEIRIRKLRPINWSHKGSGPLSMIKGPSGTNRIARMPFEVVKYSNGLVVSNFLFDELDNRVNIKSWIEQSVNFFPTPVTIKEVVRHVADKGGGAHVDKNASYKLNLLYQKAPTGTPYAEVFTMALGRLTQHVGEKILGYEGCKVPFELTNDRHEIFECHMLAHVELAEALREKAGSNRGSGLET
jgi:hypothetical protein